MKRLLLAGAGHAHAAVLGALARTPLPATEVVLVTPEAQQMYSGMLPGWMAGHYALAECTIDVAALAARAGVRLVAARVQQLDAAARRLRTDRGESFDYDLLSINTGPVLHLDAIAGLRLHGIALRPMTSFVAVWERVAAQFADMPATTRHTPTVSVIGGGAGGVELAFAIAQRARALPQPLHVQLVTGRDGLLPTLPDALRDRVARWLPLRRVRLVEHDVVEIAHDHVVLDDGATLASSLSIAALGAHAAPWPRAGGLAVDDRGFIAVDETLRSTSHPNVFAAGDCATIVGHPRPKSGVYAVRAGPPLARNLRAALAGARLARFVPQAQAMYLLGTGPRHAVGCWSGFAFDGAWVWRLKESIDRRFVARHGAPGAAS